MTKYINASNAAEIISEKHGIPLIDLVDTFAKLPAADVVEVVRCKDCVWYSDEVEDVIGWCDRNDEHAVNAGGFCSHGERKQP